MSAEKHPAYRLFWNTEHIHSNEKVDARLVRFSGWDNCAGLISARNYDVPDEILFTADFSVTQHSDYPVNDVNWPLMSRRMLDVLLSLGEFPHRAIPVRLIDERVPESGWRDADGRLQAELVDDRFVAVQLRQHLDAFDRERSEYEADDLFPDEVGIVHKLVLRTPAEGFPPLFRLAAKPGYLFVSTAARKLLQEAGIQGALFWGLDKLKV